MTLPHSPIASLEESHGELLALCDALEAVADSLPHAVNTRMCLTLSEALEPMLNRVHRIEQDVLFPMLAASQSPSMSQTLARLREEQFSDHAVAVEVGECLHDLAKAQPTLSADAIGYLLRSFFESMRRHVQSERELVALAQPSRYPPD